MKVTDCKITCTAQVVIGDQMTCKNIRTGKLWMTPEIQAVNQLKWANEVPGRVQKSYIYLNK